ncbi:MAG: hypothetical protein ACPKM0_03085 [Pleomorphochaeta sp.]
MIKKAMDCKLNVKPLMGVLVHSGFWEGPCRGGIKEEMMPEIEMKRAKLTYEKCKEVLKYLNPEINVLEPVFVPYYETFVVADDIVDKINKDINETDCIMVLNQRIPKIERFNKPVISYTHAVSGADTCAYLRSINREAYYAIDTNELNEVLHKLWVKKALSKTRALILTAGEVPTWGLLSNIKDLEGLRSNFGFEVVKKPFTDIFKWMDQISDEEAKSLNDKLLNNSKENRIKKEYFINDIKYYLAAKKMLEFYNCNAFSTACVELCVSKIPQERKFVPCVAHSLFKDEKIPSGCEEDLNALLAMTIMMYSSKKPAFMGNPLYENDEMITLHHSVPCLKMNGYDKKDLEYSIYSFTGQNFGGKIQIDFAQNESEKVTICRFDPTGKKMLLKTGNVLKSEYTDYYCSPYYYIQVDDARKYIHNIMNFGHHQVLIFGDYTKQLNDVASLLNFEIVNG